MQHWMAKPLFPTSIPRPLRSIFSPPPPLHLFSKLKTPPPLSSSPYFPKPLSSSSPSISPTTLKLPLFLKPPIHSATLSDLKSFHIWARDLSLSIGSSSLSSVNDPEPSLLHRELNWLLEDTLEEKETIFNSNLGANYSLGSEENERVVRMKVEMEELYRLWKARVEERRPFQYIVGCEHWRDLVLGVQEGVLIPRPETELIVDMAEEVVARDKGMGEGVWVDLGTGSGAIAIGIGRVLGSGGRVIATDLSSVAVDVAGFNVDKYGLQDKIEIRLGSWFEPLEDVKGKLAGLVSNPPYIPSDDIPGLQPEVVNHEPKLALDGGKHGTDDLLHLCDGAASFLKPGGVFIFETNGDKQSKFLVDFMNIQMEGSFQDVNVVSDFAGIQRFVTGFRR